jgi:formylglycine-generating enzyme required for sulfatase activity
MRSVCKRLSFLLLALCAAHVSQAADVFNMPSGQTSIAFASIGNPGNANDAADGDQNTAGIQNYGAVPYTFAMDKYDITTAQYTQFLNAVAATDTYSLYNAHMALSGSIGCGITRSGVSGSYTYGIVAGHDNYPVNYVGWGDAARFANWINNGQPTGAQNASTTEDGAYTLSGATSAAALIAVTKNANAKYWIPSENEWYKSAYYNSATSSYFTYATGSNTAPSNVLNPAGNNNANYYTSNYADPVNYWTDVGFFAGSPSPYGTFDQNGLVFDWNDAVILGSFRGMRGGSFVNFAGLLTSSSRFYGNPTNEDIGIGFRVASSVPEPGSIILGLLGGIGVLFFARVRKS